VRNPARAALLALALVSTAAACGGSDGSGPDDAQVRQAVEQLQRFGLTEAQAGCVVDRLGADTVVEAADLSALADSATYRAAAEACADAS
jgi:hypothetical protein